MKRFTDTDIWDQDWFIELPNKYKLFWFYLKDSCDNGGFWRPNKSLFQKIIGEPLTLEDFLNFVNTGKERIRVLPTGRWFLKEFFVFQYGDKFSPTSHVHKGAMKTLVQNGVHLSEILGDGIGKLKDLDLQSLRELAYNKDIDKLSQAYGNPSKRVKVKDKDSSEEKVFGEKYNEDRTGIFYTDGTFQLLSPLQQIDAKTLPANHFQKGIKY